jgi:hypothetical protein
VEEAMETEDPTKNSNILVASYPKLPAYQDGIMPKTWIEKRHVLLVELK